MSNVPGHYHAEGDPPDTVRYWDGTQWVGDPIPAPPAPGSDTDNTRFATLGVRIGAALLDAIIAFVVIILVTAVLFGESDGDGGFSATANGGEAILVGLVLYGIFLVIVAQFGGTPGKLLLGLRITEEDGRTQVGYRGAFMRSLPNLISNIPIIGFLVALGAAIMSIIWINGDDERRSAFDRIGSTRVVRKAKL